MHAIDETTGTAAIAFAGATPWHGLGADMGTNQDMGDWRKRAGLNWEAQSAPVQFNPCLGTARIVPDRKVLYRSDTFAPLGLVSNRYQAFQPADVMDFYKELCENHGFSMETAGALHEGRVIWALAKTGEEARISGSDALKGFVLLSTSFDGSMATTARHTSVRVVCNNTLHMADADKSAISVRHNTVVDANKVREALGIGAGWQAFADNAQKLAETGVTAEQSVEYFMRVYHGIVAGERTLNAAEEKTVERTVKRLSEQLFHAPGAELRSAKGTAWGLLNAVTHDIDFNRRARSQDTRLTSAWFGQGAQIKAKALEAALQLAA
jgi:phage/plasmid-like protein (TIGR03299 family)